MLVAAFSFASMGVCVKFGSAHFNSGELVFYRGVIGVLCM
jgi:S-adenosylmethionine uptake transporter